MQTLSFVPINLHRCRPCEWKRSIWKKLIHLKPTALAHALIVSLWPSWAILVLPPPPARFKTTWPKKATVSRDENGVGSARRVTLSLKTRLEEWPGKVGHPSSRANLFLSNVNSLPRFVTKCVWKDGSSIVAWVQRASDPSTTLRDNFPPDKRSLRRSRCRRCCSFVRPLTRKRSRVLIERGGKMNPKLASGLSVKRWPIRPTDENVLLDGKKCN